MAAAHFSHPDHELRLREYHLPRTCDLCGGILTGSGYSCRRRRCRFDLHEDCAGYPETLRAFFAHPWHDLTLARAAGGARACCDLCREDIPAGAFAYNCAPCGFHTHPRCSRLPQAARNDLHPDHAMTAVPGVGVRPSRGSSDAGVIAAGGGRGSKKKSSMVDEVGEALAGAGAESLITMLVENL
ncbi:uncharacterized protein LOC120709873 [Panicum virgatum]|uniref:uncharacterized protein LOC120709873 n=1 Tax=Panicum virgatum TaxID=38727 RepID=UPI0019D5C23B|nr:uncharacterized protein LOC120709873 [Panicum virgatum]